MKNFIDKQISAQEAQTLLTDLQGMQQKMAAFYVGLSDKDRTGLRTMAEGREGYARLIANLGITHIENLARDEDPAELQGMLDYYAQLNKLRLSVLKLLEQVDDTQTAAGYDAMKLADRYAKQLQARRGSNAALDLGLREVDDWNSRFGSKGEAEGDEGTPPDNGVK